jgi:hypothetical protein
MTRPMTPHGPGDNEVGLPFPHMEGGELVWREHVVDFGELTADAPPDSGRWVWPAADLLPGAAPELEAEP